MSASPPPLSQGPSPQQVREIEEARVRFKPIRRAIGSATFFGWSVLIFGALSLVCSVTDITVAGLFVGFGLCVIGYFELTHVAKLKKLDPNAPVVLGRNQFALAGLLVIYAVWQLMFPSISQEALSKETMAHATEFKQAGIDLTAMNDQMSGLVSLVWKLLYGSLIAVALAVELPMAFFYFRRSAMVKDYVANTPAWIVAMQQSGMRW